MGLNPMAAQFMALQHPAFLSAAQVSAASAGIPPFGLPNPAVVTSSSPNIPGRPEPQFMKGPNAASLASLEALQRSGFFGAAGAAYIERMREGQKSLIAEEQLKKEHLASAVQQQQQQFRQPTEENKRSSSSDSFSKDDRDSPILNLSAKHDNNSDLSGDDDVYVSDNDIDDLASNEGDKSNKSQNDKSEDKVNNNGTSALPVTQGGLPSPGLLAGLPGLLANTESGSGEGQLASVYGLMSNIQALIKVAVENAKKEERTNQGTGELKTDSKRLEHEMEEVKKNRDIYLRRFKKEKRYRRKVQEQLEVETQRRLQMEEALRSMTSGMTSSEALKRITETLTHQNQTSDNNKLNNSASLEEKRSSSPLESSDKARRESGDDPRSSPASSSASNVALAAAAAAAAAAQFNATVST